MDWLWGLELGLAVGLGAGGLDWLWSLGLGWLGERGCVVGGWVGGECVRGWVSGSVGV